MGTRGRASPISRCWFFCDRLLAARPDRACLLRCLRSLDVPVEGVLALLAKLIGPSIPFGASRMTGSGKLLPQAPSLLPRMAHQHEKHFWTPTPVAAFRATCKQPFAKTLRCRRKSHVCFLNAHFPESVHEEILAACASTLSDDRATGGGRDPNFRKRVLTSYEYRCALCKFQLLLSGTQWLSKPHISNGTRHRGRLSFRTACACVFYITGCSTWGRLRLETICLCSFPTRPRDPNRPLMYSSGYHGTRVSQPIHTGDLPAQDYLEWHHKEVFRGRSRPV